MSAYIDREQTQAKHFILRGYLQELAFKVLHFSDIAYIDGFSGPWESKTDDFSDTSFMIALNVLKDAQRRIEELTGTRRTIKCFFSEKNADAYRQMTTAVAAFHQPGDKFEIKTYRGEFVDAVGEIRQFIGNAFPLLFIDPTGWTEYPLDRIAPLFAFPKCEVLVNFMYGHISRFLTHPDPKIIASLDPILGGPGWQDRLDPAMARGPAVEKLFRENLKAAGKFDYVVSTRIDKGTEERPHFFLVYGTKDRAGLIAFRNTEHKALREHAKNRSAAMTRKRDARSGTMDMFADHEAAQKEATIDDIVTEQKKLAKDMLCTMLAAKGSLRFTVIVEALLQAFMIRETNAKDICVELAAKGKIRNSWGMGVRKPNDETTISLV
ncbi:MAG: three-Cys-motif partner protein TcmP [Bradyrhizobium sp.]|nr:three-Cys-motif partner protein TcmP [Bradyrhizobium sp.]